MADSNCVYISGESFRRRVANDDRPMPVQPDRRDPPGTRADCTKEVHGGWAVRGAEHWHADQQKDADRRFAFIRVLSGG